MDFLEAFDRRAEGRSDSDSESEALSSEDEALLDFADLIRSRRAAPSEVQRERVLARLRDFGPPAQQQRGPKPSEIRLRQYLQSLSR